MYVVGKINTRLRRSMDLANIGGVVVTLVALASSLGVGYNQMIVQLTSLEHILKYATQRI